MNEFPQKIEVNGLSFVQVGEPKRLTPFENPEAFPEFENKTLSKPELFSFARYLLFETNFFTSNNKTFLGDYFDMWQKRQEAKHWD